MSSVITAHVVVDFGDDSSAAVSVEIDSREDGYNHGKTSFLPGEDAYLLLYMPPGWECTYAGVSAGNIAYVKQENVSVPDDYLTFIEDEPVSLSKYPYTAPVFQWLGTGYGAISVNKDTAYLASRPRVGSAFVPPHRHGIAKASYYTEASLYKVSGVPVDILKAVALFVVSKIEE